MRNAPRSLLARLTQPYLRPIDGGTPSNDVHVRLPSGRYVPATPEPYYHRLLPFIFLRLTRYRDACGRKAQCLPFRELFLPDI